MILDVDAQGYPLSDGRILVLPPKERAVLALLIRRCPQAVSKQDFADEAWQGRLMSDESLARCISRIRSSLAGAAGVRIDSVYGTGYRLHADVPGGVGYARMAVAAQAPPQAVEAFLHARRLAQQRTPAAMERAMDLLRRLVAQHPRYAAARIALAEAIGGAAGWGLQSGTALIDEGLGQLGEAARLDPQAPGLAAARAYLLDCAWRYDEARKAWDAVIQRAGDDPETLFLYGRFLLVTGDTAGAVERLRAAVVLHPFSALVRVTLARALANAGDVQAALDEAQAACNEHPDSAIAVIYRLGLRAWAQPDAGVVAAAWAAAEQRDAPPIALSVVAYALARTGMKAQAIEVVEACLACSATSSCTAVFCVAALVAMGEHARALNLLMAAEQAHCGVLPMALRDPACAPLLGHPAFQQMLLRIFGQRPVP